MRSTILTLAVTLALVTMAAAVAANHDESDDLVSASGECYSDDYSEGGQAHLAVTSSGQVEEGGIIGDLPGNGGIIDALSHFAVQSAQSSPGEACDGENTWDDDENPRKDYLAVTVLGVMVCYDGDTQDVVWTNQDNWDCHSRPVGNPDA